MLIKISLILAVIGALTVGILGYLEVSQQIPALVAQRNSEHDAKVSFHNQLTVTNKLLASTRVDLAQTKSDLADSEAARSKAEALANTQEKRADDLTTKLAQANQEREDARNQLEAYTSTGLNAAQVVQLNKQLKDSEVAIKALNEEKALMVRRIERQQAEIVSLTGEDTDVKLPAGLRGKIMVVDPKWDFVVVNVGGDQGMLNNGELLVSRDGKLVGKVIVRSVLKDRSIANMVPGWEFGEVLEGDSISPAHPRPAS